MYNSKRR